MAYFILKYSTDKEPLKPEHLLVLNEEGAVAVFLTEADANEFMEDFEIRGHAMLLRDN